MKIKIISNKIISAVPDVRQSNTYSCGSAALMSILNYYQKFDGTEDELSKELKTNSKDGTKPESIVRVAKKYGLAPRLKQYSSIQHLKGEIDKGNPVIVNYQAWPDKKKTKEEWKKNYSDGHYSVLIGVNSDEVILEDPSILGKRIKIPVDEFISRWHDKETSGEKTFRMSIVFED